LLSGEAESGLERLHHCAENELKQFFIKTEDPSDTFNAFRMKLTGLTTVTKTYFENLVKALENGLVDVTHNEFPPDNETKSTQEKYEEYQDYEDDFLETQRLYDEALLSGCYYD